MHRASQTAASTFIRNTNGALARIGHSSAKIGENPRCCHQIQKMDVSHISFDQLKDYWAEVDHFRDPDKKFREVVHRLGPYTSKLSDPRRFSYGLFDGPDLVGATHLVQWSDSLIRYRTLNVREAYRGRGLGAHLLCEAVNLDWRDWKSAENALFGWIRRDHRAWAENQGFQPLDGQWHDDHVAMSKPLNRF